MAGTNVRPSVSEVSFKFNVPNVSALNVVWSPEFIIYGVPWKIKVIKEDWNGEPWLKAKLFCAKKDKLPQWTHAASATFKLLSFDGNVYSIEKHSSSHVYDYRNLGWGPRMLRWNNLFSAPKPYVKDDKITLEVKIEMADPNESIKSELILEKTEKNCCATKYRFNVTNIENLMAARSNMLTLQNEPWYLIVSKTQTDKLDIKLICSSKSRDFSCDVKMSAKMISLKPGGKAIEKEQTRQQMKRLDKCSIANFVSWKDLRNPNNGFINNDSIVIDVEIKFEKPGGISDKKRKSTDTSATEVKRYEMACTLCSKRIENQDVSFTSCGHLFCTGCINNEITVRKECPVCKTRLRVNQVKRAHLPFMQ